MKIISTDIANSTTIIWNSKEATKSIYKKPVKAYSFVKPSYSRRLYLARLSQGLLKGEELINFIKHSYDMIK